jgi:hypothetical protein
MQNSGESDCRDGWACVTVQLRVYDELKAASVVRQWSELLATDPEVPGSIPSTNTISEK